MHAILLVPSYNKSSAMHVVVLGVKLRPPSRAINTTIS
jgi:hypothetical protein